MVENLISFAAATLALAVSPGPDNIYVLTQSLRFGSASGIATTAGLISGCIVHTSLLAFGVSAVITASPNIFYAIKVVGALYLLFLAYKVYRSESAIALSATEKVGHLPGKKSHTQLFKIGVIMNLVNPKVMIFFLAFFPAFLWDEHQDTVMQFFILGGTFMLVSFLTFSGVALLAGGISKMIQQRQGVGVFLKWLQIVVFVGIAVYIMIP